MFRHLVRLTFQVVRSLLPWIWRFVRMAGMLAITCVTSIFVGIPTAVNRIADSWITQATEGGLPANYHPALRTGALVVASITLILGWLVLASLTVFLIRLLLSR